MPFSFKTLPETLCSKCERSTITTYDNGDFIIMCHDLETRLTRRVTVCTAFEEKGKMSKHDMGKVAWILESNKGKQIKGFVPPNPTKYPPWDL